MPERLTRRRRAMFANRQRVAGKGRDVALAAEPFVSLDVVGLRPLHTLYFRNLLGFAR